MDSVRADGPVSALLSASRSLAGQLNAPAYIRSITHYLTID